MFIMFYFKQQNGKWNLQNIYKMSQVFQNWGLSILEMMVKHQWECNLLQLFSLVVFPVF